MSCTRKAAEQAGKPLYPSSCPDSLTEHVTGTCGLNGLLLPQVDFGEELYHSSGNKTGTHKIQDDKKKSHL